MSQALACDHEMDESQNIGWRKKSEGAKRVVISRKKKFKKNFFVDDIFVISYYFFREIENNYSPIFLRCQTSYHCHY